MAIAVNIKVEFYGIPRSRAGVAETTVTLAGKVTVAEIIRTLAERFPDLAESCFVEQWLRPGYAVNVGGSQFLDSADHVLVDGETLLILSADAGG